MAGDAPIETPPAADRASRRELALLYEHLPSAIAMFERRADGVLGLATANRRMLALARTLGLPTAAELRRGMPLPALLDILASLHRGAATVLLAGLDEAIAQRRNTVVTLDGVAGGALDLEATIVPVSGRTGPLRLVLLALRDITEERAAALRQRALEEQLARNEKLTALGTLAGGLAHDFGNVLTGIAGHAELLQLDIGGDATAQESLAQIFAGVRRAQGLVNQVLAFARRRPPARRPLRLDTLAREALAFLSGRVPANVTVVVHDDGVPAVLGDVAQLAQVLDNLVTNALHALEPAGGTLTVHLDTLQLEGSGMPADRTPGRYARVRIRDTGPGIAPEHLARIFEPFFTTKGTGRGTGLGLAVVHGVVEAHDGMIGVESQPGRGALFTVLLPAASVQAGRNTPSGSQELPRGAGERVLVVDDEPAVVESTVRQLERLGYRAWGTVDPANALAQLRADPFAVDAVLTDYSMPVLDGGALAQGVRAARADLPLVIMSANLADMPGAARALFAASLFKPFSATTLAETLDAVLGTRREG